MVRRSRREEKKERKQLEEKAVREDMKREKRLKFEINLHEAKLKLQSEINGPEVSEQHTGSGSDVKDKLSYLNFI